MFHQQMTGTLILGLILFLSCQAAYPAQSETRIKVGISPFSPFIIMSKEGPIGLSIDLWQALSRETGLDFEFVKHEGVADKLNNLQEGSLDVAIGGITISAGMIDGVTGAITGDELFRDTFDILRDVDGPINPLPPS